MRTHKVSIRFSQTELERISQIVAKCEISLSEFLRNLILEQITIIEKNENLDNHQATGKYSLMRTERLSLILIILNNLILREHVTEEKQTALFHKAVKIANKGWHYKLDEDDVKTPHIAKTNEMSENV